MTMRLAVLGSTGSIGACTLDLAARHPERVEVFALAARADHAALLEQCRRHRPRYAALEDASAAAALAAAARAEGLEVEVLQGAAALEELAGDARLDCVMAGIVGLAGLAPALAAVRAGTRVLLANKEALAAAGGMFMEAVRAHSCTLVPVDSEHNALFQCLAGTPGAALERVTLTASGGPFRGRPPAELADVTPAEACAHPTWRMGRKISVDSATMMNKGLEVIEARWLFDLEPERIDVVIHPQSVLHAMATLRDGSTLAHLGPADMRVAIGYALFGAERAPTGAEPLDLAGGGELAWSRPEPGAYPCLDLARRALDAGGAAPTVLNAANEVAVDEFLRGRLRFPRIAAVVERALEAADGEAPGDLDAVRAIDESARAAARAAAAREAAR